MKIRCFSLLLSILVLSALPAAAQQKAAPEDFRKMTWGAELEGARGLLPYEKKPNMPNTQLDCCNRYERCYTRDGDKLTAGKAELQQIVYCATNNKFTSVVISFPASSYDEMKEILDYKYGSGVAGDSGGACTTMCTWKWPNVEIIINKMMNTLVYRNTQIRDEEKKKIDALLKEKINDL